MGNGWRLGCIGVGAMGQALVKGIIQAGIVPAHRIWVSDVSEARLSEFSQRWQVNAATNEEVAAAADVVLIAVKPGQVVPVLQGIASHLQVDALVISIAAGVPLAVLERPLRHRQPVIRAMPNTPCLVGAGAVAISLGRWATPEHEGKAKELFGAVAEVVTVSEEQMDAVTGLSGSGPAYVFTVIQALTDAGVTVGLDRATAHKLAVHTVFGSARMVAETGEHPAVLRDMVTSPGGTTAAGLAVLERRALRAAFLDAVIEATRRSAELGRAVLGQVGGAGEGSGAGNAVGSGEAVEAGHAAQSGLGGGVDR